jgi:hypothetical protein
MISYPITICPRCGSVSCIRPGGWDTTDVCERCEKEAVMKLNIVPGDDDFTIVITSISQENLQRS